MAQFQRRYRCLIPLCLTPTFLTLSPTLPSPTQLQFLHSLSVDCLGTESQTASGQVFTPAVGRTHLRQRGKKTELEPVSMGKRAHELIHNDTHWPNHLSFTQGKGITLHHPALVTALPLACSSHGQSPSTLCRRQGQGTPLASGEVVTVIAEPLHCQHDGWVAGPNLNGTATWHMGFTSCGGDCDHCRMEAKSRSSRGEKTLKMFYFCLLNPFFFTLEARSVKYI